ncbi:MAG: hypothetical protein JNL76_01140 [Alphaproteobacteria bacterium]|nr:hypothetical protein [Alphaproteobacteria bacterium]
MTKNVSHIFTGGRIMNCSIIHQNIKAILEEDGTAYSTVIESGGVANVDYAGYCCHISLNRLRQSLNSPNISVDRLEGLLRRASRKHTLEDTNKDWAYVMARFLTRHVNANSQMV